MNSTLRAILEVIVASAIWMLILYALITLSPKEEGRFVNCGMAEFHPDYTTEMRQQCRVLRSTKL